MAAIDAALVKKVFYVAKREWKSDVHNHTKLDDLGRSLEVVKRVLGHFLRLNGRIGRLKPGSPDNTMLAVGPSLAGWAALLPMVSWWPWPRPSLVALALILLASPMVDIAISRHVTFPCGWLRLRVAMATGLGSLTLAMTVF